MVVKTIGMGEMKDCTNWKGNMELKFVARVYMYDMLRAPIPATPTEYIDWKSHDLDYDILSVISKHTFS